jgi:hypothetical protein
MAVVCPCLSLSISIVNNLEINYSLIIILHNSVKDSVKGRYKTGGTGQLYDGFPDCEWKMNTP